MAPLPLIKFEILVVIQTTTTTTNQNTSPVISTTSLSFAHEKGEKKNNNSAQISSYIQLTLTTGPTLGGQKPKEERIQPLSLGKGDIKHNKLKKRKKGQRNTTQMKEQTRNTEVQISEEEIGKLPEKEFRAMIVKIIKNLENKMEKMQDSINID